MNRNLDRLRAFARGGPRSEAPTVDVTEGVATFRLYDPVDSWGGSWGLSAREMADVIDGLEGVSEIRLHINSPGGEVFDAIAIVNLLRSHDARVVAIVDGIAASAASFIAASADETIMAPNSEMMIHDAWGACVGNAADMTAMAKVLDSLSGNIASIYATKAGTDIAAWREAMAAETWFTADEAVDAGLADRVDTDLAKVSNRFDLSIFTYAGRDHAPAPDLAVQGHGDPISHPGEGDQEDEQRPYRAPLSHLFA